MPLSDILKALIGVDQPKPGATQAPGTVTSGDIYTPGVESLISAVPALIGSYEQGRGKPIGNVLSTLGQFGLTNAANRQKQHQDEGDVAARIESLASRGLTPQQGTLDPINQMTPGAADKDLRDLEASQVKQQEIAQATAQKRQDFLWEHQKPFPLVPGGKEAYVLGPNAQPVRAPQYDEAIKKAGANTELGLYQSNKALWSQYMADKAKFNINTGDTKLDHRAGIIFQGKMKLPFNMVPEFKTSIALDRNTMRPVSGKSAYEILSNPDKYAVVDRKTGTETIPNLASARREVMQLASYTDAVLPSGGGDKASFSNYAKTLAHRWGLPFKAAAGGVNEAMFEAKRTSVALQLQKVFTGSTRPVNQVEFTRITGDGDIGLISMKDIEAVLPTSRDTKEIGQVKYKALQEMFDNK